MRFFYDNLIDASGVVVTTSSEQSDLPAANVTHEHKAKVWRTGSSVALEYVVFDLGSAQSVTSCIIFNHTLLNTDTLIKIQGNSSDSWASPAVDETLTWSSGAIFKVFAGGSYRYWRFTFTKASAGVTRDIGRIFLGTYYTTTEQPDDDGLDIRPDDLSVTTVSRGGQEWTDARPQYRAFHVSFSAINSTQTDNFKTISDAVGEHTPFFVVIDETASTSLPTGEMLYVKFKKAVGRKVNSHDGSEYKWDVKMELKEQL
ncbi:MAG: hypothetical protein AB1705_14570 [Verrucomicrobiota bacterium]